MHPHDPMHVGTVLEYYMWVRPPSKPLGMCKTILKALKNLIYSYKYQSYASNPNLS